MAKRLRWLTMAVKLGLALVFSIVALSTTADAGDDPPATKVLWSKSRSFQIPVTLSSKNPGRVREMLLYISDDDRYTWKKIARTTPESPIFSVRVAHDGEYWFAVQTLDVDGKLYPNNADKEIVPSLRVIVDSTKPMITLESTGRRGSDAGVRWEVKDDHLILRTMTLEYQEAGARDWRRVPLESSEIRVIGIKNWDAGTVESVRARMSVRDQAGNTQTVELVLPDGLAANPGPITAESRRPTPPQVTPIATRATPPGEDDPFETASPAPVPKLPANDVPETLPADRDFETSPTPAPRGASKADGAGTPLLVKSPKFSLKYDVQDAGPSGPALVELWTTRDGGRNWNRQPADSDNQSPYNVDLGGEGKFGLWLVVQSASGLGDVPPQPDDRPQSWVEVDSTPPAVSIDRPRVGKAQNIGKVLLTWRAGDAHLAPQPISLFYREDKTDAQWILIADRLDNTGRYIWAAPGSVPPKFHIKVEAIDTLGNRGVSDTQDMGAVLLDRAKPKGRIIGLDQPGGTARQ